MRNSELVRNEDINSDLVSYRQTYKRFGRICFELTPEECSALSEITQNFRAAKKDSGFDNETWATNASKSGLFSNEKSFCVFSFLVTEWKNTTNISTRKENAHIIVEIFDTTHLTH